MPIRTDPPVSEAQRRFMRAAEAGDIPGVSKSVGREFSKADPGGKLPEHVDRRADQLDACADSLASLTHRMDAMEAACDDDCARDDEWSDEARKKAAEARGRGIGSHPEKPYRVVLGKGGDQKAFFG